VTIAEPEGVVLTFERSGVAARKSEPSGDAERKWEAEERPKEWRRELAAEKSRCAGKPAADGTR
jgi:hypothetical protein